MTEREEYSIPRKALEIIVSRAASEAELAASEERAILRKLEDSEGVTVGAWTGKYCCPLTLVHGHNASNIAHHVMEVSQFQSNFDWLMDEYFERSLIEHGTTPYEVKIA